MRGPAVGAPAVGTPAVGAPAVGTAAVGTPAVGGRPSGAMSHDLPGTADGLTRRRLLLGGAAMAGTASLGACSSISVPPQRVAVMTGADSRGSAHFVGLEIVAVSLYRRTTAPGAVRLPPAVTAFAAAAMGHHQRALDQWNGALALAQAAPVTLPAAGLQSTVDQSFAKVTDTRSFARLALLVEQTLSDTYLATMPSLVAKSAATLAGAFQAVGGEHIAVLHFLLGEYPVPDAFQKTDHALPA